MTEFPQTTPLPPLVFLPAQSHKSQTPTPTQTQIPNPKPSAMPPQPIHQKPIDSTESLEDTTKDQNKKPIFPLPKLLLEIRDLNHPGTSEFLSAVNASKALATSVESVLTLLYHTPDYPSTTIPTTRSVKLVLRSMGGVAYTTGSELDDDHKEIHFSLDYIHQISASRKTDEIMGVLTHEMVHCYQYNAFGSCPGGLIEGIADWVRLNAGLSPPHWKQEASEKWDAGYQQTGYFLQYLETRFGKGTVRRLNEKLRIERYEGKKFWTGLCGGLVEQLWGDYQVALGKGKGKENEKEEEGCVVIEKEDVEPASTSDS